jgi:hypothetical protein
LLTLLQLTKSLVLSTTNHILHYRGPLEILKEHFQNTSVKGTDNAFLLVILAISNRSLIVALLLTSCPGWSWKSSSASEIWGPESCDGWREYEDYFHSLIESQHLLLLPIIYMDEYRQHTQRDESNHTGVYLMLANAPTMVRLFSIFIDLSVALADLYSATL